MPVCHYGEWHLYGVMTSRENDMSAQSPVPSEDTQIPIGSSTPSLSPSAPAETRQRALVSITITQRSLWQAAALVVAVLAFILVVSQALGPFIFLLLAVILGEAIRPLVSRLARYRMPAPLAILAIYLVALAVAGLLIWLLLSPLVSQIDSLAQHLPRYHRDVTNLLSQLQQRLKAQGAVGQTIQSLASSLATGLQQAAPALLILPLKGLHGIFGLVVGTVVVLTMTLFWVVSSPKLKQFVVGLFPPPAPAIGRAGSGADAGV
jgi:predicted PurR-regulated permease PerM